MRGVFRPQVSSQQTHPKCPQQHQPAVQVRRVSHELLRHERPQAAPQYEPHQSHKWGSNPVENTAVLQLVAYGSGSQLAKFSRHW